MKVFWLCSCCCFGTLYIVTVQAGAKLRILLLHPRNGKITGMYHDAQLLMNFHSQSFRVSTFGGKKKNQEVISNRGYFISQRAVESAFSLIKRLAFTFFSPICSIQTYPPSPLENSLVNWYTFSFFSLCQAHACPSVDFLSCWHDFAKDNMASLKKLNSLSPTGHSQTQSSHLILFSRELDNFRRTTEPLLGFKCQGCMC